MVSWISSWASGIVISIIIGTILEMILPEGNNKKYIKTVIGIYIIFAILSPIVTKISGKDMDLQKIMQTDKFFNEATIQVSAIDTDSSIENIYISNLKIDIKSKLKEKGYEVGKIEIEIETQNQNNYGKIYSISLEIKKQTGEFTEQNNKNNISIEEVRIDTNANITIGAGLALPSGEEPNSTNHVEASPRDAQEIKEYISNTYEINKDKIQIM